MIKTFANKQLKALWETGKSKIDARMHGRILRRLMPFEGEGLGLKSDPKAQVMAVGEAPRGPACPSCGQFGMQMIEGCMTCPSCGHSKCG
ncbi:MAG: hypothetical protein R3D61_09690 [Defluviimonas denitrificans]